MFEVDRKITHINKVYQECVASTWYNRYSHTSIHTYARLLVAMVSRAQA